MARKKNFAGVLKVNAVLDQVSVALFLVPLETGLRNKFEFRVGHFKLRECIYSRIGDVNLWILLERNMNIKTRIVIAP